MVDERELLAKHVQTYRKQNKLSQEEFADECGISKDTMSLIERRKENVTIDTVQLIAARMGVDVSDLFSHSRAVYVIIESKVTVEGITKDTYGIGVLEGNKLTHSVADMSTDKEKVLHLIKLCNKNDLSPIHLMDVVEDFLC